MKKLIQVIGSNSAGGAKRKHSRNSVGVFLLPLNQVSTRYTSVAKPPASEALHALLTVAGENYPVDDFLRLR